jgi:ABC-type nickel/cobalt efflux system permease component RcnA
MFLSESVIMDKQQDSVEKIAKPNLLTRFAQNYSGNLTATALQAISAWMIVTGVKGMLGFNVTQQTAAADLLGVVLIIGVARWVKVKYKL